MRKYLFNDIFFFNWFKKKTYIHGDAKQIDIYNDCRPFSPFFRKFVQKITGRLILGLSS